MKPSNSNDKPKTRILRSENDSFLGAYPFPTEAKFPSKYPCEDAFLHGSVASATDCTGIAVVTPETDEEAKSLMAIKDVPVTSVDGDGVIPEKNQF